MARIEVGYICSVGHFCFWGDPEEAGNCGSKRVGTIWAEADHADDELSVPFEETVGTAEARIGEILTEWRDGER